MSGEAPDFRFYPLTGEGFELLKAYNAELKALRDEQHALIEEYQNRRLKCAEARAALLESIWRRMAAMAGLDPDKTWKNPSYQIEERYINSGFGAITFVQQNAGQIGRASCRERVCQYV